MKSSGKDLSRAYDQVVDNFWEYRRVIFRALCWAIFNAFSCMISPAIFGSLFLVIMDGEARRNLGAHYISEGNILKLVPPLLPDALWAGFEKIKGNNSRLFEFH